MDNLISAAFFFQISMFILMLAVDLFIIDQTGGIDANALLNLNSTSMFFVMSYVFCYLSENITAKSLANANIAYEATWYKMSNSSQKAIGMIIMRSQREYRIVGFGMVECSLEVFLTVISISRMLVKSFSFVLSNKWYISL